MAPARIPMEKREFNFCTDHIDGDQHSRYLDNIALCKKYDDYFKFAFVRNPWDLAISWYLSLSKHKPDTVNSDNFKKFLINQVKRYNLILNPVKYVKKISINITSL
jgi:hypothetical protein